MAADRGFLEFNRGLLEQAELYEINPESLWRKGAARRVVAAEVHERLTVTGKPVVGHGILFSLGAASPPPRRELWLAALAREQAAWRCEWYSEHLGFADSAGMGHVGLPLPLPPGEESIATVVANLALLKAVFPLVAFENNVAYFTFGDPLEEIDMFREICRRSDCRMVLDLHNVYTMCINFGIDMTDYLERIEFGDVIEIHLSGGSESDPTWLPGGRTMRIDTHDAAVPEPVWKAFDAVLPRCTALRAVVIEWGAIDIDAAGARQYAADFARARKILCS